MGVRLKSKVRLERLPVDDIADTPTRVKLKVRTIDDIIHSPPQDKFDINYPAYLVDTIPTLIVPVVHDNQKETKAESQNSETQNYVSLIRNLVKNSGLYAIASLSGPLVTLALAPFLTKSLTSSEYGALVVLNTAITLVAYMTQLGLSSAIFRAYNYDYEDRHDQLNVLSTSAILLFLTSLPMTFVIMMAASWFANFLLGSTSFSIPISVAALAVLTQNLSVPGLAWLRAENRAIFFSALSIVNLLITLGANIILVGVLQMGITGSLLATAAGYAVISVCTLPLVFLRTRFAMRLDIAWNLLSFGVPVAFNNMSFWILQLADRYLLSRLGSLSETASYSVAYSLGAILNVVILSPFLLAWPTAMFAVAKRKDASQVFQLIFRWFNMVLLLAAFILALIATVILEVLFPPSYHSAAPVIPIVALSTVFYGIYNIFAVGVGVRRKTWLIVVVTTLSALVNIGCNIILIPPYGSMGAALSTLIAYALLALIMYIVNRWVYPVPFEIIRCFISILIGIILYTGSGFLAQHQTPYVACAIYAGFTILFGGCLVLIVKFPIMNRKIRDNGEKKG